MQLTIVLNVRLYLTVPPPITALGPGPEETRGVCTHGGTTPDLLPVHQTPYLTLT